MIETEADIKRHKIILSIQPPNREYELTLYEINGVIGMNSSERNGFIRKLLKDLGLYIKEGERKHADMYKISGLD